MYIMLTPHCYSEVATLEYMDQLTGNETKSLSLADFTKSQQDRIRNLLHVRFRRDLQARVDEVLERRQEIEAAHKDAYCRFKRLSNYLMFYNTMLREVRKWHPTTTPESYTTMEPVDAFVAPEEIFSRLGIDPDAFIAAVDELLEYGNDNTRDLGDVSKFLIRFWFGLQGYERHSLKDTARAGREKFHNRNITKLHVTVRIEKVCRICFSRLRKMGLLPESTAA